MADLVYRWTFQLHASTFEYQITSLISQMINSQNFAQIVGRSQSMKNMESLMGVLLFSEGKASNITITFSTFCHPFSFFKYFFPDIKFRAHQISRMWIFVIFCADYISRKLQKIHKIKPVWKLIYKRYIFHTLALQLKTCKIFFKPLCLQLIPAHPLPA